MSKESKSCETDANETNPEEVKAVKPFKLLNGAVLEKCRGEGEWMVFGGEVEFSDDFLPILSGADSSSIMLMKPGVGGLTIGVTCSCSKSGTCDIVITISGKTGKKKMKCTSAGCTGSCGISISIPSRLGLFSPA